MRIIIMYLYQKEMDFILNYILTLEKFNSLTFLLNPLRTTLFFGTARTGGEEGGFPPPPL